MPPPKGHVDQRDDDRRLMNIGVAGSSSPSTIPGRADRLLATTGKTVRQIYRLELSKIGRPPSRPGSDGQAFLHLSVSFALCAQPPAKQVL